MENLPCHGYRILYKRLKRLKHPGIYVKADGTLKHYKPIANERKIYQGIKARLEADLT